MTNVGRILKILQQHRGKTLTVEQLCKEDITEHLTPEKVGNAMDKVMLKAPGLSILIENGEERYRMEKA